MTANNIEEIPEGDRYEFSPMIADADKSVPRESSSIVLAENKTPEELDRALTGFAPLQNASQDLSMEDEAIAELDKELAAEEKVEDEEIASKSDETPSHYVEVSVKRGDSLERIAKGNGTTIEELKKANNLKNDKLLIGQVLKVPLKNTSGDKVKKAASVTTKTAASPTKTVPTPLKAEGESEYHVVKVGDNPWKIAKQYHVKVDDLLKLNGMNEEKARNMKVGDKIRVR
jgi:LysM repeat protein